MITIDANCPFKGSFYGDKTLVTDLWLKSQSLENKLQQERTRAVASFPAQAGLFTLVLYSIVGCSHVDLQNIGLLVESQFLRLLTDTLLSPSLRMLPNMSVGDPNSSIISYVIVLGWHHLLSSQHRV